MCLPDGPLKSTQWSGHKGPQLDVSLFSAILSSTRYDWQVSLRDDTSQEEVRLPSDGH